MRRILQLMTMLLFVATSAFAQTKAVSGTITDASGAPLPGVSVVVKGTTTGGITDADGKFNLKAPAAATTVTLSFVGYKTTDAAIPASGVLDLILASSENELEAVVVTTGSRNSKRVLTDTPLPIDILSSKDLASTGQMRMDQALQYRVPSFNTVNTPVNDATTLLDPYEIRNMGPSRTLILINGKRKNLSSLLYVQFSPGRGETGVDVSGIPMEAVKRVEILRDGASAQYGSDAIAGVMNFILKDKYDYTSLNVNSGVTAKGDGATYGITLNSGGNMGAKGFVNYTLGFTQQDNSVRSGKIDVATEIETFGNPYGSYKNSDGTPDLAKFQKEGGIRYDGTPINSKGASATLADVTAWNATGPADNNAKYNTIISNYLSDYPTGGNINGTGEITAAKFLINAGTPFGETGMLYANAAMVSKRVLSNANFRTPYWRQDRGLLHKAGDNNGKNYIQSPSQLAFGSDGIDLYKGYIGYMPSFEGDLLDYNATIGATNDINGWKSDLSLTTGGNTQRYTVDNTVNRSLGKASPTRFKPGGFGFNHLVGNIDVSKAVTEEFSVAIGAEARSETYTIMAGDTASYKFQGSNSFPGIDAVNAGSNSRFNLGAYIDASYDISKDFLINGTVRSEKYSDFGPATVGKISTRYKFNDDKVVIRGSYSTGFRAPSLHQIYAQSIQASFAGGVIQTSGLYNNRSAEAKALGIPTLRPEKSTNISLGVGLNPTKDLSITLDYYNINVKDRIVYSSSISSDKGALGAILKNAGLVSVQFFINGIETNTSGLDFVVSQKNLALGSGKLAINLAGNYTLVNEIVGAPAEPQAIKDAGSSILNEQIKSLLTESRPKYKVILGFDYVVGKFVVNLNNTLFGPTAFRDYDNGYNMGDIKAVFKPAVVTDLNIGYRFTEKVAFSLSINNLLNILPKWDLVASSVSSDAAEQTASAARAAKILNDPAAKSLLRGFLGFSGRYDILGYNGSQFSQLGTVLNANLNIKF